MRTHSHLFFIAAALALPATAQAAGTAPSEVEFTFGIAATTAFDAAGGGLSHSENTGELKAEISYKGFHTGLVLTSLYQDPADDFETEWSLGYGGDITETLSWDITYARIWLNRSGFDSHEVAFELSLAMSDALSGAAAVIVDPETRLADYEIGLEYAITDRWTIGGLVGRSDRDDNTYGEIGVEYAFNDQTSAELLWEDTSDGDPVLSFTLAYEFGL